MGTSVPSDFPQLVGHVQVGGQSPLERGLDRVVTRAPTASGG